MSDRFGIRFKETQIWVIHRRQEFGPFDYEWSVDFRGVELMYQGQKFGEYCSSEEFFADLSEFNLPQSVYSVATIALGKYIQTILKGLTPEEQHPAICEELIKSGYSKYAQSIEE